MPKLCIKAENKQLGDINRRKKNIKNILINKMCDIFCNVSLDNVYIVYKLNFKNYLCYSTITDVLILNKTC